MLFAVVLFALFGRSLLTVHCRPDDIYPLVLEELYSKPAEARYQFCQQTRFTAVYSTGVYYKAILKEDDTSLLKLGKAISRTRAFTCKFNPYSGHFFEHKVTLEGSDEDRRYHDFVAFAGAHLDLFNRTTDLFVELSRKVQAHNLENDFALNEVAFSASRILAGKHIALDSLYAQPRLWNMCFMGAFNQSGCCLMVNSGKCAPNRLFPPQQVRLASPEDHYALLFIKQQNMLVQIRSRRAGGAGESEGHRWTMEYQYVRLTDSTADVSRAWKTGASSGESLHYRVIGAIEHYKRYYLVTTNDQEKLQLLRIADYSVFPLRLDPEPIDFHDFFRCQTVDFAEYYQTVVNAVVVAFCCSSYWVCRKAADYQRKRRPMVKGNERRRDRTRARARTRTRAIARQLRPVRGSEKEKLASQYLLRTGADHYYVDEMRMQRDERRVFASIANMAKQMLHTADVDQLKEKIARRKAAKERRKHCC